MSDLDNEEIEATKKLQEKSADELFEELGYTKYIDDNNNIEFYKYGMQFCDSDILYSIRFYSKDKEIGLNFILSMQELKAINKKCKEMKWI